MIPIPLTLVGANGVTMIAVAAGSVPATAVILGGLAFSPAGALYVVLV